MKFRTWRLRACSSWHLAHKAWLTEVPQTWCRAQGHTRSTLDGGTSTSARTHTPLAPTTRRTNDHQVHSYTVCQTNCSSARDGRRASYRKYMKMVGEPGHPQCWSSTRGRPLGRREHHIEHLMSSTQAKSWITQTAPSHPPSIFELQCCAPSSTLQHKVGEPMGCKWGGGSHPQR
jgi:hypothetical protein